MFPGMPHDATLRKEAVIQRKATHHNSHYTDPTIGLPSIVLTSRPLKLSQHLMKVATSRIPVRARFIDPDLLAAAASVELIEVLKRELN